MKKTWKAVALIAAMIISINSSAQKIPVWKLHDLQTAIASAKEPTIINFWATFCKPCLKELPHFQALVKKYEKEGVKLVLVSLDMKEDYPKKVASFKTKLKLTSPVVFLDENDADLFCPAVDKSWSGSIPATLFINPLTGYRQFHEDELSKEQFEAEVKAMLKTNSL